MNKIQILIVEDEGIVAMDIQNTLKSLGYDVPAAVSSGEEAIKKAGKMKVDLVLMDIVLKGDMNGIEAAKQIRDRFDIPVIYLSAYADDKTLEMAKITEPYGYILKPYNEKELSTNIDMAIYKHKAEKKIKDSEQWLTTTLKSIGDAVITTDTNGCITFMNPIAETLTGWNNKDALGKPLKDVFCIINEKTGKQIEDPGAIVLKKGVTIGLANHTLLIARDGKKRPIDDSGAPIKDDKGKIIGVVLVFRDITRRKQAEMESEKLHIELREKNNELEQIIYVTSHDFRSPLVNIQGFSKELNYSIEDLVNILKKEKIPAEIKDKLSAILLDDMPESLKYIQKSVLKMDLLLSGLLRLLYMGKAAINIINLDINTLVSNVLNAFEFLIKEKNIKIKISNLMPCKGDVIYINQVFSNLIDNAIKFLNPQRPLVIKISSQKNKDNIIYCIEDNGFGIPKKSQKKIFEIFYRLNPDNTPGEGVGLNIVSKILSKQNGTIWVESEEGKGSKFFLSLPSV